jgi:hypothetical protein
MGDTYCCSRKRISSQLLYCTKSKLGKAEAELYNSWSGIPAEILKLILRSFPSLTSFAAVSFALLGDPLHKQKHNLHGSCFPAIKKKTLQLVASLILQKTRFTK